MVSENDKPDDNGDMIDMALDEESDLEPVQENEEVHPDILIEIEEMRNRLAEGKSKGKEDVIYLVIPKLRKHWGIYFEFESDKALRIKTKEKGK